jgi:hypothetical protein
MRSQSQSQSQITSKRKTLETILKRQGTQPWLNRAATF